MTPNLPRAGGPLFLNDSGLETTLVFHDGRDLPCFAAFPLLETEADRAWLARYYDRHLELAEAHGTGFVMDTPTWRANPDWGARLGYGPAELDRINRSAVAFCREVAERWRGRVAPVAVAGVIGPRGDGYRAGGASVEEAQSYHAPQIAAFAEAGADIAAAYTLGTVEEAVGIVRAARQAGLAVAISFTVETDGRLASGTGLGQAIEAVDAATDGHAAYFMVNCAHPLHFAHVFAGRPQWADRIRGLKANASTLSHAELDESAVLDEGDPGDLARRIAALRAVLPSLALLGGCCGTDHRHVGAIAAACCGQGKAVSHA